MLKTSSVFTALPVPVNKGGTGQSSLPFGYVLIGNGTAPVSSVDPGTSGNILTSDGTTWNSVTPTYGTGSVTSVATAGTVNGLTLTGGPITTTGTVTLGGTLDLSSPPAIGSTAANTGAFTTLSASSTVSGTGFSTYLASPPAIGGTTAAAGTFTTLTGTTSTTTPIVQNSAAAAIAFKTNSATSALTQFNINHIDNSVNYVQVAGAATTASPSIVSAGSDGAIGLLLSSKSTSSIFFYTNNLSANSRHLDITHTGSVANRFQITGSQTGNPVVLTVNGNNADIDITLTPKGAGRVNITTSIKPKVNSTTSVTSPLAWNSTSYDEYALTALANALTISADANTAPADGQRMMFRFKDNGTARALTWTTGSTNSFRVVGVTLPTTTVASKLLYVGCIYNAADSRWDAIAVGQEA